MTGNDAHSSYSLVTETQLNDQKHLNISML
jgi:hypothetical protein